MVKFILLYCFSYLLIPGMVNSVELLRIKLQTIPTILFYYNNNNNINNNTKKIIYSDCIIGKIINELKNDLNLGEIIINFNLNNILYDLYIGGNNFHNNNNNNNKQDLDNSTIAATTMTTTPIWFYYQNNYCIIYANTKRILAHSALMGNLLARDWILFCTPIMLTAIYFSLILRFRFLINKLESITKGMLYALQTHLLTSVPARTSTFASERIFLASMLIFIFELNFLFQAYLTTQITIPTYKPSDEPIIMGTNHLNLTHRVGFGKVCINEILDGVFKQRICMLECTEADLITEKYQSIYRLQDMTINFHGLIKVNKETKFYRRILNLIEIYTESGLIDKWFKDEFLQSYKNTKLALENHKMSAYELKGLFVNTIVIGLLAALFIFIVELLWFYRYKIF